MQYAIVNKGFVINVVEAKSDFAETQGWVELPDGFGIGDTYDLQTGFSARPGDPLSSPVLTVSAAQFKIALARTGKLDIVLSWLATQDIEVQLAFDATGSFRSDSSVVAVASLGVGMTADRVYELFQLAASIEINSAETFNF